MGCSTSVELPRPPTKAVYEKRHRLLYHHLCVTDLVRLIESFIPLGASDIIPLWYLHEKTTEFYLLKPHYLYGPVVWNYYACHYKGVRLYVLTQKFYKDYTGTPPTQLKLQILDQYFSNQMGHPKCLGAFQTILKNRPLSLSYYNSIIDHLEFWIYIVTCHLIKFPLKELELEGFFPVVWIMFRYILRSKTSLLKKKNIVNFLIEHPFFCHSIQDKWTNLAGEFLDALSTSPTLGDSRFLHALVAI